MYVGVISGGKEFSYCVYECIGSVEIAWWGGVKITWGVTVCRGD